MEKLILSSLLFYSSLLQAQTQKETVREDTKIICVVPELNADPGFPGGVANFQELLRKKLSKRSLRKISRSKEYTYVNFIIGADGSISGVTVSQSNDTELISDVKNAIRSMPKWTPCIIKNKPASKEKSFPLPKIKTDTVNN